MEYDDSIPGFSRPKKPAPGEEDITDFPWQNGPVTVPFSADGLFSQEERDQLSFWLQCPPDDICPTSPPQSLTDAEIRPPPPIQSPATKPENPPRLQNLVPFSRNLNRQRTARETTVVDSNETPMFAPFFHMPHMYTESDTATAGTSAAPAAADRKRKTREVGDTECEEETKKQARISRAAEVHNQSEKRRRERINEKLRTLQELIPRCTMKDTASLLDEAIAYLKSLQCQVQMIQSMGCGMVPMMYHSTQQFVPAMGMNWRMFPYPSMQPIPMAHMAGPRFPMAPPLHMQPIPASNPCRIQTNNQADPPPNSVVYHHQNQAHMLNFVDPNQQFIGLQQPLAQNQAMAQPGLYQAYQQRNWQP